MEGADQGVNCPLRREPVCWFSLVEVSGYTVSRLTSKRLVPGPGQIEPIAQTVEAGNTASLVRMCFCDGAGSLHRGPSHHTVQRADVASKNYRAGLTISIDVDSTDA